MCTTQRATAPSDLTISAPLQNVGMNMAKTTMTFAVNVTTAAPDDSEGGNLWDRFSPLSRLVTIATVNNKAQFEGTDDQHGDRKVLGDATDSGLLRFCDKIIDVDDVRDAFASVFSIPFNSKNKWALNMVRIPGDADSYVVMIKGAPEYVLKKCGHYFQRGKDHVLDDDFVDDMTEAYGSFGTLAERVIGHAYKARTLTRTFAPVFAAASPTHRHAGSVDGIPRARTCAPWQNGTSHRLHSACTQRRGMRITATVGHSP